MGQRTGCFWLAQGKGQTELCRLGKVLEILSSGLYRALEMITVHTQGDIFCDFSSFASKVIFLRCFFVSGLIKPLLVVLLWIRKYLKTAIV